MVLPMYFSLFGLGVSSSKMFFIFECGCSSGSNNLNFFFKSRACKHLKIFCPSVLTFVALYMTRKQVNVFHTVFHDETLKS